MKSKICSIVACVVSILFFASCNENKAETSGFEEETTTTSAAETTTTEALPLMDLNPLTGVYDIEPGESVRPICIMIGNNDKSRPQYGLDKADMYFETETEGGITRIMAVFSGTSTIPEKLGPVRSARTPFVLIAQSLDAIYCHAGGSVLGIQLIEDTGIDSINTLYSNGSAAVWRDEELIESRGTEYSMMTSGEKLTERVAAFGYSTASQNPAPFTFNKNTTGSGAGNQVQIRMSSYQTVNFVYDASTNLYSKWNGTLTDGEAHVTADGVQLTAANVIIMYDEKYNEDEDHISFRLKSGTGLLITGGTSRSIAWSRTANGLQFTEENGSSLAVTPGKTYVCLTDEDNANRTVLK